jgi:hypothetical protein
LPSVLQIIKFASNKGDIAKAIYIFVKKRRRKRKIEIRIFEDVYFFCKPKSV